MSFCQASDRASSTPTEFVEFALIVDLSVLQIRSTSCVHGRDFARSGEKRILGVTFKENPIGMNSNGVRASSFFSFLFSLLVSSSSTRRNVSFTRIVIRRPGRNDSANGTTLAVVSSRRATRRHDEGEKRERERVGERKK